MHAICVIYNPAAGRGRALRLLKALPPSLIAGVELRPHVARWTRNGTCAQAAEEGFAKVIAAGGDGTVHEVANGVLQSERRDVIFGVWPIGSANDFAYAIGMDIWWLLKDHPWVLKKQPLTTEVLDIDVGRATTPNRSAYFVCNLGVGFNGMVNGEARETRWLKGLPLYAWAFIKSMVKHFDKPTMTIRFDDVEITTPTLALSVLNGQREGNFPLRPNASLTDGLFDYMHATRLTRWHLLRYLPAMVRGTLPERHKLLKLGRAARISVHSEAPLCVHADGEFVCEPHEGLHELTVEVLPARLKVEVYPPALSGKL